MTVPNGGEGKSGPRASEAKLQEAWDLADQIKSQWKAGAVPDTLAALDMHQSLRDLPSVVLDLAYEEYRCRREAGEMVEIPEFCARFPWMESRLTQLLKLESMLEKNLSRLTGHAPFPWPKVGDVFLKFELIQELGRGGFARVFLANDTLLGDRQVVVKIAPHGQAEAQLLGPLKHPNVVSVYSAQVEQETGLTAICMPYCGRITLAHVVERIRAEGVPSKGKTLFDLISTGGPADDQHPNLEFLRQASWPDAILGIGIQLCEALDYVHGLGIQHRDLKPSNVLLTGHGQPLLLDFNLSEFDDATNDRFGGTLMYMAPEHLRATTWSGQEEVDERADLYALGVVLYELLTGEHPFGPIPKTISSNEFRHILLERQQAGARWACLRNQAIDAELAGLLDWCLAWDPKERPASAQELLASFRDRYARVLRTAPWRRRHAWASFPIGLAASVLIGAATVLTPGAALMNSERPRIAREDRGAKQAQAPEANDPEEILKRDPTNVSALMQVGQRRFELGIKEATVPPDKNGHFSLAHNLFDRAFQISGDPAICEWMGNCYQKMNAPKAAIAAFEKAIKGGHKSPEMLNNLALLRYPQPASKGLELLDEAIELNPEVGLPHANRALFLLKELWRTVRSSSRNPDKSDALSKGGAPSKEFTGRLEKALKDSEQAITLCDPHADIYYEAACIGSLACKFKPEVVNTALEHLSKAVDLGADPKKIAQDPFFAQLRNEPGFQAIINREAPKVRTPALQRSLSPKPVQPR